MYLWKDRIMKIMNLGLIIKDDKILLGMKKRGFGADRWNGYGGKTQEGESVEDALKREFFEEAGIKITKFEKQGIIEFHNDREDSSKNKDVVVHIYRIISYDGNPVETEEMKPRWFKLNKIPYKSMWPDDIYWLPLFINNKKFKGEFWFEDNTKIIKHKLVKVEKL